ncbi:MAG: alkaline phosphatase family protein, partial [Armatimonadota bacterium]|nr:alkaline phosphatase family protein [Armatimonadota bacterium]
MSRQPEKLLVLGLDAALPDLLQRFSVEGVIPNLTRLMQRGSFARVITTFPPLTAAAWSAITTGAGPGETGVPSLMVHFPGEGLDEWHTSFDRRVQQAETLWEAAARAGRRTALINWPVTWPMANEGGVQVAAALNPPFRFFYMPLWDLASSSLYATRRFPCNQIPGRAVIVNPQPASAWRNLPASSVRPLEIGIEVPPTYIKGPTYHVALVGTRGAGYDEALICRERDAATIVTRLRVGDLGPWLTETFQTKDGARRGRFRFQLVALSPTADDVRLYATAINTAETYTIPDDLTGELESVAGPFMEVDDPWGFMDGWLPLDAYMAQLTMHNAWWTKATAHVLRTREWDLAFSWVGTIDHIQHVLYAGIEPKSRLYDPATAPRWLGAIRQVYREVD